jgi:hypothetical protein
LISSPPNQQIQMWKQYELPENPCINLKIMFKYQ